jgi:hypothetical protein
MPDIEHDVFDRLLRGEISSKEYVDHLIRERRGAARAGALQRTTAERDAYLILLERVWHLATSTMPDEEALEEIWCLVGTELGQLGKGGTKRRPLPSEARRAKEES